MSKDIHSIHTIDTLSMTITMRPLSILNRVFNCWSVDIISLLVYYLLLQAHTIFLLPFLFVCFYDYTHFFHFHLYSLIFTHSHESLHVRSIKQEWKFHLACLYVMKTDDGRKKYVRVAKDANDATHWQIPPWNGTTFNTRCDADLTDPPNYLKIVMLNMIQRVKTSVGSWI